MGIFAKRAAILRKAIHAWLRPPGVFRFDTILAARAEIRAILGEPRYVDPLRLERSGYRVYSQFDEDGIIAEIFRRIGATGRIFVEFGAGDGFENCTAFLLFRGWRGLWIEGDAKRVERIRSSRAVEIASGKLSARNALVTPDNIDSLIASAGFEGEIDLLSVDIDGNDYHVLEAIEAVRPRVVVVEYNSKFPPPVVWVMPRNDRHLWDETDQAGASLAALHAMMAKRGYALVGCSIAGVNASSFARIWRKGSSPNPSSRRTTTIRPGSIWRPASMSGIRRGHNSVRQTDKPAFSAMRSCDPYGPGSVVARRQGFG